MTFGFRVKAARERLVPEMTQGGLGGVFGITDKAVSSWERNKTHPAPNKLPELRRVLRVTYIWLLEGDGPPPDPNDPRVLWDDQAAAGFAALGSKNEKSRKSVAASR